MRVQQHALAAPIVHNLQQLRIESTHVRMPIELLQISHDKLARKGLLNLAIMPSALPGDSIPIMFHHRSRMHLRADVIEKQESTSLI